jgi:choline dehydrogenase-like flavoprotein
MFLDARTLSDGSVLETDVCIVGAGPAGLTLARELGAQPYRVCVVESGGDALESRTQELSRVAIEDGELRPAQANRRRQVGGNAHLWRDGRRPWRSLARFLPLDEIDFRRRPWVPDSGWPFGRDVLDPYYARAHRLLGLGPCDYSDEAIRGAAGQVLPLDPSRVRTSVEWFGDAGPFVGRCLPDLRQAAGVTVLHHANASDLEEHADGDRIARLRVDCMNGIRHWVRAEVYVLAAGGIENPRLLLASNGSRPAGLGNAHDVVGRYFMDHLLVRGVFVPADRRLFEDCSLYDVRTSADGRTMGCKLNLTADLQEREGLLNAALKLEARIPRRPLAKFAGTYARLMLRNRQLRPSLRGWSTLPGNAGRFSEFSVYLQIELAPHPDNRVRLSAERDRLGRPLPTVRWKWDELTRRSVTRTSQLLTECFAQAGLGRLELPRSDPPPLPHREGCNHHMGATRMHPDPRAGVVDADCRVHGVENLYVAGSSVFPTGGYANSTLTIVALAIRLADHLRARLRSRSDSSPNAALRSASS